ncbi:DUF998 domain-containing protein [Streptomyces termitum]|uniref:DUF998 domain-containing protein n=1 Tax=Streptomyces termitum TaxID=67368 RepID=A0A918SZI3_9ACTN|nr:DUF998 domain-containing protein [Streptomyces termitum]GHA80625.1 hypothetical protein GCM10010305_25300 [Streptomyces termitum]
MPTPVLPARPVPPVRTVRAGSARWARAAVAALGLAAAAITAADLLNPGYSPVTEVISRYVNGTAGRLITLALLLVAGASALAGVLLHRAGAPRAARRILAVWTAGVLVAGIFPADPPGRWSRPSTADLVHGTAATPAFLALPVAALLLHRWAAGRWARGAVALRAVLGTSLLATAALLVCLVDVMDGPSLGLASWPTLVGLVERIAFGAALAWLALIAVAAVRTEDRA